MIDTIFKHRTIRKYKSDPIDEKILERILEAGTRASTTGNMQVYSMVVTKDTETKKQLWESHFKQDMVLQAPVVVTFCADFNRFNKWCEQRNAVPGYDNFLSFYTASIDALLASQNVALAAEEYGTGYLLSWNYHLHGRRIIDILKLPKYVVPVTTLVIGYPAENPGLTDRLPLEGVIHNEKYTDYTENDIDRIYAEKEVMEFTKELLKINQKETLCTDFYRQPLQKSRQCAFFQRVFEGD
jgi:nitroreductase